MNNHTRKHTLFYHKPKEEDTFKYRFQPYIRQKKHTVFLQSEGNNPSKSGTISEIAREAGPNLTEYLFPLCKK